MFSDRLKQARKNKKLSQAELSRQLGVTQQAVGKWETGRSTPDPATVARLAELLGTTTDMLLGVQQPDFTPPVGSELARYSESPIPVVGTVRAGYGALAFEEDYGTEYACVKDPSSYFYLVVKATVWSLGSPMGIWRWSIASPHWKTGNWGLWYTARTGKAP